MNALPCQFEPLEDPQSHFLGTAECLRISAQLTSFENNFFGPDFTWSLESMETWLRSGCLFYAAVCQQALPEQAQLVALASVLLTGAASCERLLRGEIREPELVPWFLESPESPPIFYFSSVVSDTTKHLISLYGHLMLDVDDYLEAKQLRVHSGFSIATGPAGFKHLSKNGFRPMEGSKYLQKYDFMRIDAFTAQTEFWRQLLSPGPLDADSAKEVEARLRRSKAKRYRELYGGDGEMAGPD